MLGGLRPWLTLDKTVTYNIFDVFICEKCFDKMSRDL